ncbi:MAG TPA: MFS transporter [Gammaproteobacteria bacterium]|nr:MFS transporter [Gammaproteobacteria bacterium]
MTAGRERAALAVLFVGVLLAALDIAIVGPALPAIQLTFAVSPRWLPAVFSVYVLFYLVGTPLLAKRSDRYGRRRVFLESLAVFAAGSLLVAAAWSFPILLLGRAIQAFGAGGLLPVAAAVIAETVPLERRGRTLGLIGAVFGAAFLLGPLLGGLLLGSSWRWLFVINVPVAFVLMGAAMRVLPRSASRVSGPFDALGSALLAVVLAAIVVGIGQIDTNAAGASLQSLRVWPCLVLIALGVPLLWTVEKRAADPVLPPALLRSAQLRVVGVIAIAVGAAEAGMVFLPAMAVLNFGIDEKSASLTMLPLVLTLAVGAPLAGWLLDHIGARRVVQLGLSLTVAGLLLFGLLPLDWPNFYLSGALVGFGMSALLGAPLRYIALHEAGEERRGAGQGLLTLCVSVGQLVGAAIIGGVVGSASHALEGYRHSLLAVAGACALALVLSAALRGRVTREPGAQVNA